MKYIAAKLIATQGHGTYVANGGQPWKETVTNSGVSTSGCVVTYTKTDYEHSGYSNESVSYVYKRSLDLKQAVISQSVPDGWAYRVKSNFDVNLSEPYFAFQLKFVAPQSSVGSIRTTDKDGKVIENQDTTASNVANFVASSLQDATSLQQAINEAIVACGGAANIAPPEPVKPPPPAPRPPPQTACKADGPTLEETQKYILQNSKDSTDLDHDTDAGTFTEITNDVFTERFIVNFMSLDCGATNLNTTTGGELRAWIECKSGQRCINYSWDNSGEWREKTASPLREHGFATSSGDWELTRNLQHALMHYIFLLQQEFRAKHGQNDPFGQ